MLWKLGWKTMKINGNRCWAKFLVYDYPLGYVYSEVYIKILYTVPICIIHIYAIRKLRYAYQHQNNVKYDVRNIFAWY